jgi:hypothetical protein
MPSFNPLQRYFAFSRQSSARNFRMLLDEQDLGDPSREHVLRLSCGAAPVIGLFDD